MTQPTVALIGSDTLLGRDLREQLAEQRFPARVEAVSGSEESVITQEGGEPVVLPGLESVLLNQPEIVMLAGPRDASRRAFETAGRAGAQPMWIDLTGGLEEEPAARICAPSLRRAPHPGAIHVIAHPAALALVSVLDPLYAVGPVSRTVASIFEPASERGQPGIDELQRQTASLLSFRPLPKEIFDAQISFNMLPRYGTEAPVRLEGVEQRIERHVATMLGASGGPLPSLRLLQAPVFHGYSVSLWIEFERRVDAGEIAHALDAAGIDVRTGDLDPPTNAGVAGQSGVSAGVIEADRSNPKACWLWLAGDNYRLVVDNAILAAREFLS